MSYTLFNGHGTQAIHHIANRSPNPDDHTCEQILEALGQSGLGTRVNAQGLTAQTDVDDAFAALGGAETSSNLHALNQWFSHLQQSADYLTRGLFKERMIPYIQHDNRSVVAAIGRSSSTDSVNGMLAFIAGYVHKDIKHPIRTLPLQSNNGPSVSVSDYNHQLDDDLQYTEAETGTYHTLISRHHPADRVKTYSVYLEDTPLVRRYLRYIDSIAIRHGVRLVYCPKTFDHLEEVDAVARPTWTCVDDCIIRQHRGTRYRALFVSLAFVYDAFSPLTRVETEVQPNQRVREAQSMTYTPVVVEYLDTFVHVLKQLGAFSVCKIYYKGSRTPARS